MKNWIKFLIIIAFVAVIPCLLSLLIKKEPESKVNNEGIIANIKKPVDTSNWINYSNSELGFLIKIPPESYGIYRCSPRKVISVPVKVFEDNINNAVYIVEEYYYDADNEGGCKKITQSLESLRKDEKVKAQKPFLGWKIVINNVLNKEEVLKYIKENFGSQCIIQAEFLREDGNYNLTLTGERKEDSEPWYGSCYLGFAYKIIYSPEKNKMMSVVLGQEGTFQTDPEDPSNYQYYEDEMLKSFEFK
jgi:hypothetical protein